MPSTSVSPLPALEALHSRVRADRATVLADLTVRFRAGRAVEECGALPGVILAATVHPWLDAVAAALGPHPLRWRGKILVDVGGENLWRHRSDPFGWLLAVLGRLCHWRLQPFAGDISRAVPFRISDAPSVADAAHIVRCIDYDVPANPRCVRRIRDELVDVGDGLLLGRGYYRLLGRWWPWVWFALCVPAPDDDWHR